MDSKPRRQASNQNVMVDGIKCSRKVKKTETDLLNVCGRYRVADIDLWPISTLLVADMVFCVADIIVADMVCGRYPCNSPLQFSMHQEQYQL